MVAVCQKCGDPGFSVALIYCDKCQEVAKHRYCLDVIPKTFTEYVTWFCEDCNTKYLLKEVVNPKKVLMPNVSPYNNYDTESSKQNMDHTKLITSTSEVADRNAFVPSQPIFEPVWSGCFKLCASQFGTVDGVAAHFSTKASLHVLEEARLLLESLSPELLPRLNIWPNGFIKSGPKDENIALYFLPQNESYEKEYAILVDHMIESDLAMRAAGANADLLIFTSMELPLNIRKFQAKNYLWGVFRGKDASCSSSGSGAIEAAPRVAPAAPRRKIQFPFSSRPDFGPDSKAAERFVRFRINFEVHSALYPDFDTLNEIRELYDVEATLVISNLGFLCSPDPGTYERLVYEFLPSFDAVWEGEEKDPHSHVVEWRFMLGGRNRSLSRDEVMRIMEYARDPSYMVYMQRHRDAFWAILTEKESQYVSGMPSTMIASPRWKVIHRFIAENLNVREDGGRLVNNKDMDAMMLINENKGLDPMTALTRQWKEYQDEKCRSKAIGGGVIVSLIALNLGYSLSREPHLPKRALDKMTMEQMKMRKWQKWVVRADMPERSRKRIRVKMRNQGYRSPPSSSPAEPQEIPSQSASEQHGNADFDLLMKRMDSLVLSQEAIARNQRTIMDQFQMQQQYNELLAGFIAWTGDMMRLQFSHMGIDGFVPPPTLLEPYRPSDTQMGDAS